MKAFTTLLVEDNPVTRKLYRVSLEIEGHRVLDAENGASALALALDNRIDLVLQDLRLPDIDGLELAERLRALPGNGDLPIVAITGFTPSDEADRQRLKVRFTDVAVKPVEPKRLVELARIHARPRGHVVETDESRKRVLLVDDDPLQRKLLELCVRDAGYEPVSVEDGERALDVLGKESFDAVLSDVLMPAMDGFLLCLNVRKRPELAAVRVILFSSSYVEAEDEALARRLGASAYVVRSSGFDDALSALEASMRSPAPVLAEDPEVLERAYFPFALERQRRMISSLAGKVALQSTAVNVLGHVTDSLAKHADAEDALGDVLAYCLDAAGLAVGAIYLFDAAERAVVRTDIGRLGTDELSSFFGHPELLDRVRTGLDLLALPSRDVDATVADEVLRRSGLSAALLVRIRTGGESSGALFMGAKDSAMVPEEWRALVHNVAVQLGQALSVSKAFTRIAAAERANMVAERLASLGTLASGIAHEINNPLTYVLANLETATTLIEGDFDETRRNALGELLRETLEGAERMRRIVHELRLFSRVEDEAVGGIDLHDTIDRVVTMVGNEVRHRAKLVREYSTIPLVAATSSRASQIVGNLLVNAAQSIPEGRAEHNEIRVRTWVEAVPAASGTSLERSADGPKREHRSNQVVVLSISDTGAGIPEDLHRRVFDPFFTTKPVGKGTGLGLSICHKIVRELGGELTLVSAPGQGTTFRVALPAWSADDAPRLLAPLANGLDAPGKKRGRVLVVDDEQAVCRLVARTLGRDHEVLAFTSANEALARVFSEDSFDAIVCDLMMPETTGMDVHDELVKRGHPLAGRILFLTGGAFGDRATTFLEDMARPRLYKPFSSNELRSAVQALVELTR
jgi:CheY-like chemotaxis protein